MLVLSGALGGRVFRVTLVTMLGVESRGVWDDWSSPGWRGTTGIRPVPRACSQPEVGRAALEEPRSGARQTSSRREWAFPGRRPAPRDALGEAGGLAAWWRLCRTLTSPSAATMTVTALLTVPAPPLPGWPTGARGSRDNTAQKAVTPAQPGGHKSPLWGWEGRRCGHPAQLLASDGVWSVFARRLPTARLEKHPHSPVTRKRFPFLALLQDHSGFNKSQP